MDKFLKYFYIYSGNCNTKIVPCMITMNLHDLLLPSVSFAITEMLKLLPISSAPTVILLGLYVIVTSWLSDALALPSNDITL